MKNKIIGYLICLMLLIISFLPCGFCDPSDDEIVRWDTTAEDVIVEPYTLPFFDVYELKDYGQTVFGLASADFNNDGWLDFAVGWTTFPNDHSGISIFYREEEKSFRIHDIIQYPWGIEDLEAVDFNNDGYVDLLSVRYESDGVYSADILWNDNDVFDQKSKVAEFRENDDYWINPHIATADFDMDSDVDFIAGANCGKVKLFKNDGGNNFIDSGEIFDYGAISWGLAAGDFNNDGYPDFIVSAISDVYSYEKYEGYIYLKLNDKTSNCFDNSPGLLLKLFNVDVDIIGACDHGSLSIIDYDGDGDLDFLAGYFNPFLYNNHDGMFDRFPICNLQETKDSWDSLRQGGFTTGDFNCDGKMDFVAGGVQGVVRLFINKYQEFPPIKPEVTPPGIEIITDVLYDYTFTVSDINEDDVYLFVDWGDGTESGWLGPFNSGEAVLLNHIWMNRGSYSIKSKAKDIHGNEGAWGAFGGWVSKPSIEIKKALLSQIYLELDPNSPIVQEIKENYESPPEGLLTNIDITIERPNSDQNSDVMIAPFFRTLFAQRTGIGSIEPVLPQGSVTIHIPLFIGDISENPFDDDLFIVDGWVPFISWK